MSSQFKPLSHPSEAVPLDPENRLIVALDFPSAATCFAFLDDIRQRAVHPLIWVKVGLELFLIEGASLVRTLREQGYRVFVDLKLHDIPNTVASSIRALGPLEADLLTVHAAGGAAMLSAAAEAAAGLAYSPRLLAVTVLTSLNAAQLQAIGASGSTQEQVLRLAQLAWHAGLRGLVASPLEAAMLRQTFGPALHLVTPGIRPQTTVGLDDQLRTATPSAAIGLGASQLVIGRPITRAPDPAAAFDAILLEIAATL